MTRRPTPDIMDAVLVADVAPDRTALRNRLRWDYSQVAPVDRRTVEDAAVDILANGQRLQQSAVAIGERLQSVKRLLPHGKFGEWCSTEFAMSQKTAENLMNVAREFGDKIETVSILTDSAMYMLAAPSTPPAARDQAIEEAQATGKSPTKKRIGEIIAQHKPGPAVQPIPTPTAKEYSAAVQAVTVDVLPPSDAPLPDWAEDPASISKPGQSVADYLVYKTHAAANGGAYLNIRDWRQWLDNGSPVIESDADISPPAADRIVGYSVLDDIALRDGTAPTGAAFTVPDGRIPAARALITLYREAIATENQYGALTGQFSDWLAPKRELLTMIGHLEHLIAIIEHPEEAVSE